MGYSTDFFGEFHVTPTLDEETYTFLTKLAATRRMKRNLPPEYGVDGEFYVDGGGYRGHTHDDSVVDYNEPPSTQPGLWCQWVPNSDGTAIVWDGNEKFYEYEGWLRYLIDRVLIPRGYVLNGEVEWAGEEYSDRGRLVVVNNVVRVEEAITIWKERG